MSGRVLQLLDLVAALRADEVTVIPGDGAKILRRRSQPAHWSGPESDFTADELSTIDGPAVPDSVELGTHPVLLNYLHLPTGVTTTMWRLPVDGGHIRLGVSPVHSA